MARRGRKDARRPRQQPYVKPKGPAGAPAPAAPTEADMALARQARLVGIVIAAAMVLWVLANLVGRQLGLPGRFAILFDLMALAAFIWGLAVTWRIWQKRRQTKG